MKLVVLDRDGVINQDIGEIITHPDQWVPIDGSLEGIARLTQAGYQIAVATNQSGIAREILTMDQLFRIHQKMHDLVRQAGGDIDVVVFCPHSDANECDCRKPAPGLLYDISERLGIELESIPLVGDSLKDMQAAMAAAMQPILVKTGTGQQTLDDNKGLEHLPAYDDLSSYVDELLVSKVQE
ncbi:MAG: D-glycero-beta-D-manno-heptose 1,7-bisphosphate 7-phosphatase [Gammaproteobacteria bacterium]|nr:D-glycero-beta-D-manno-heptose 1,7-bisphosphate 7-phosphatase [Gammaproteobacteria bacterium]